MWYDGMGRGSLRDRSNLIVVQHLVEGEAVRFVHFRGGEWVEVRCAA
jgi:hypothetical protein